MIASRTLGPSSNAFHSIPFTPRSQSALICCRRLVLIAPLTLPTFLAYVISYHCVSWILILLMTVDSPSGFSWMIDTYPHALFQFLFVISFYPYLSSALLYITLATGYEGHFLPRRRPFSLNRVSRSVKDLQLIVL